MQPSTTAFERRPDLGMRFDEFDLAMNRQGFIGHRVLPVIQRDKRSGKFPRIELDQKLQNLSTQRNPGGTYPRSKREFADDNYETTEHGLEATLDDRLLAMYDDIIDAEQFEGEVIENSLLTDYERAVAAAMFSATTFSGRTGDVTNEWSDAAAATPVTDINVAINTIRAACGVKPNALVVEDEVFRNLIRCDQVINALKNQGFQDARPGAITREALAVSLNIDEVIVAEGMYNTKDPGQAPVLAPIWSKEYALLARVAKSKNPLELCVGRTIQWEEEGAVEGDRMSVIAETYYEENRRGGVLRRRTDWGLKVLHVECGYLFSNITE